MSRVLLMVLLLGWGAVIAAQDEALPPTAPHEADAGEERVGESLEGDVTIVQGRDATYEEYRRNGRLFMVKVIPNQGYPYYLVDNDGDGYLELQRSDLDSGLLIPHWVLFSW